MIPYTPPQFQSTSFNCPACNAYAYQDWVKLSHYKYGSQHVLQELLLAICEHCKEYSLWLHAKMIYPEASGIQPPNNDLEDDIKNDYREASSIINRSPRGAAALLRLCVQKLCTQLGEKGKNINEDIANLVKKGLPPMIQQSLDFVRVIGNNAVHPGMIDLKDDSATAIKLFELVNIVAQIMITQPKEIKALYEDTLPEAIREGINKRDGSNK